MQSENKIQYSCRRIKILAGAEKCVEVMITDKLGMLYYDCEENPAEKVFRDLCDKSTIWMINYAFPVKSVL